MVWWFAGSEGIDKIFSSEKYSRDGSVGSRGLSPLPNLTINEESHKTSEQTLTLLEEALVDSQAKLNDLISDIGTSESSSSQHLTVIRLSQKIETMHDLLMQLRNQIWGSSLPFLLYIYSQKVFYSHNRLRYCAYRIQASSRHGSSLT